jgi:hypothetical protein
VRSRAPARGRAVATFAAAALIAAAPAASAAAGPADLARAYPGQVARVDGGALVWRDGTRMPIRTQRPGRPFQQRLERPDIADMSSIPYRPGRPAGPPGLDDDPGRIRFEPFFSKMYGDCARGEVKPRLRRVAWMPSRHGGYVEITSVNGVDRALAAVVRELEALPPSMTRYLVPSAGTYNCRAIAGTDRRSMHAYGAAIDISTRYGGNWLWADPAGRGPVAYRNQIPFEIVRIFERHGFIWGGKWYHYDTMHFEYRPELL